MAVLDPRSASSLLLSTYLNAPPHIATATGFLVRCDEVVLLVSNYHVLSGRDADTNAPLGGVTPDRVMVPLPIAEDVAWRSAVFRLEDERAKRLWVEHPEAGHRVDIGVLPLGLADRLGVDRKFIYDVLPGHGFRIDVAMRISIIGFPGNLPTPRLTAIWKSGHVASEPGLDIDGRPYFWIDAQGASGMSGSPVVALVPGGVHVSNEVGDGSSMTWDTRSRVIGIYSGRATKDTSLGRCWRWDEVVKTVEYAARAFKVQQLIPQLAELGVHREPTDVLVPCVPPTGREVVQAAYEVAHGAYTSIRNLRAAAELRAALALRSEQQPSIALRRETAAVLRDILENHAQNRDVAAFFWALEQVLTTAETAP